MDVLPLQRSDMKDVLAIRNHETTRHMLDNDSAFSEADGERWFDETNPEWYALKSDNTLIGYIRTTPGDNSIGVGCDIHPDWRNKGYATKALNWIVVKAMREGIENIWLQCFADNEKAISIYNKLGFVHLYNITTRGKPAYRMKLEVKKRNIDFLCILDKPHAVDYLEFLNERLEYLSAGYLQVNYKVLMPEGLRRPNIAELKTFSPPINLGVGTESHVAGMEFLTAQVEFKKFLISDYDVSVICPNWDRILSFLMNQYDALGTEYPHSYEKYTGFPTLFFSAWDTNVWKSLSPDLSRTAAVDLALPFYKNVKVFDIGSALPTHFKGRPAMCWPYREWDGMETYFVGNEPFVTHLGRGSVRDFKTHPKCVSWAGKIRKIIKK